MHNADSGALNMMIDGMHKMFMPKTYKCSLCELTYGNVRMKKQWKEFVSKLPYEVLFYHKDEFEKEFPDIQLMPASVYCAVGDQLTEVINDEQMDGFKDLDELMTATEAAVARLHHIK